MKLHLLAVLALPLLAGVAAPAMAGSPRPDPSTRFSDFECVIDLGENGLNTPAYVSQPIDRGIVSTFDSSKLCNVSNVQQIMQISCEAKIPGWVGGRVSKRNIACSISGSACGLTGPGGDPAVPLKATSSALRVDGFGNAELECELRRQPGGRPSR